MDLTEYNDLHHKVDLGRALQRLKANPDYKEIIEKGFFRDLALSKVYAYTQGKENEILAFKGLYEYLNAIETDAVSAKETLKDHNGETIHA